MSSTSGADPSINKTDRHDITEILLKVALNTINQPTISQISTNIFSNLTITFKHKCVKSFVFINTTKDYVFQGLIHFVFYEHYYHLIY